MTGLANETLSRSNLCHFQEKGYEPVHICHRYFAAKVVVEACPDEDSLPEL